MEFNQEKLVAAIKTLAEWAEKFIANFKALIHENWKWLKRAAIKWY